LKWTYRTDEQKKEIIRQVNMLRKSGKTQEEACKERKIAASLYLRWKKELFPLTAKKLTSKVIRSGRPKKDKSYAAIPFLPKNSGTFKIEGDPAEIAKFIREVRNND